MCSSQYAPNFSEKKTVRIKIQYLALKENILFLVSTRNDNISRGCATRTEFPEGRGVIGKIPSVGGYGYFLELHNKLGFYLFADDTNLLYADKNLKSGPGNRS